MKSAATLLGAAMLLVGCSQPVPPARPARVKAGRLEVVNGVRILTLRGSGKARGAAQGRLLRPQVQAVVKRYVHGLVVRALGGWQNALAVARAAEPLIPLELRQELRALARASGVTYPELLVLNAHVDAMASGCSSITVQKPAAGKVLLARNLDWSVPAGMENLAVVMVVHPPSGRSFASYTYPGFLGVLTAVNRAGVAVSMNVSQSRDRARRCVPTPLLIRTALQQATSATALLGRIAAGERCSGFLITAADPRGGRVLEMTAGRTALRPPRSGLLLSTNHFLTAAMRPLQGLYYANSRERLRALRQRLRPHAGRTIDVRALWRALRTAPVLNRATLMTVLIDPRARRLRLWERGMGGFRTIDLKSRL